MDAHDLLDLLDVRNEQQRNERLWECDGPPLLLIDHGRWEVVIDHDPDCLNPRTCVARSN